MSNRRESLKRTFLVLCGAVIITQSTLLNNGLQNACFGAKSIKAEQAGDHFVNFVLGKIETARTQLPAIARAAELAVDRIVHRTSISRA